MRGFSMFPGSWRKAAWLAAGLAVAAVLLSGWTKPEGAADGTADTAELLARTGSWFAKPPVVTLRFCSQDLGAADIASLQAEGAHTASMLGLSADNTASDTGAGADEAAFRAAGPAHSSGGTREAGRVTLLLAAGADTSSSFLIVKMDASEAVAADALLAWQRDTSRTLSALGIHGAWNAQLQGALSEQRFAAGPDELLGEAEHAFRAHPLESYKDEGTYSVSYGTQLISRTVRSGRHQIGLQAALHRDTGTGAWRLTVGTPLITGEY